MPTVYEVFTPNDLPTYTYVDRSALRLEEKLRDNLKISKLIVSVSGPSKSGKTVLIKKVIDPDLLINVSGAAIRTPENLWEQVLNWMGAPSTIMRTTTSGHGVSGGVKVSAEASIPLLAKGGTERNVGGNFTQSASTSETSRPAPFQQVMHEIYDSDYIVFIDDFITFPETFKRRLAVK